MRWRERKSKRKVDGERREAGGINIYLYCVCIAVVGLVLMSAAKREGFADAFVEVIVINSRLGI